MTNTYRLLLLIVFLVFFYLLTVFKRGKLELAKFALGTIGLFLTLFFAFNDVATPLLAKTVTFCSGIIGEMTGLYQAYPDNSLLFISHEGETISLYVDYECAGFVEMVIFVSLIVFFPLYKWYTKILYGIYGVCLLFLSNILRLVFICTSVYFLGNEAFYMSHAILGRLLFYTLSMCVYFYVFTRPQIARQKIGRFSYDKNIDK